MSSNHIVLVGDSNTWGSGATGTSDPNDPIPRSHTLATPRDGFTSASWANHFRRWASYISVGSQDLSQVSAGESLAIQDVETRPFVDEHFEYIQQKVGTDSRVGPLNNSYVEIHSGQSIGFDFIGDAFDVIHSKQGNDNWGIYIDGVQAGGFVADGTSSWGSVLPISTNFGKHRVEIKNNAPSGRCRIESINVKKSVRISNNAIAGVGTRNWLPAGVLLDGGVPETTTHLFIMLGTNDRGTNIPAGNPAVPFYTVQNLEEIILWVIENRDCEIHVMSPPPAAPNADTFSVSGNKHRSDDQARAIRAMAGRLNVGYVPVFEKLSLFTDVLHNDGLHLNDKGHFELSRVIVDYLV